MKLYDNVFWDWNGTLLDDFSAGYESLKILLKKRNMPIPDTAKYSENFCFPVRKFYDFLGFDFHSESFESVAEEYTQNYFLFKRTIRKDAKKTLEKLFLNSVNQYILSACERNLLVEGLKNGNLEPYFKDIIALDNKTGSSKSEIAKQYFATHNVSGKCLMVGDTVHDAEVAKELKMDCILIESGFNSLRRLRETGMPIIENLSEATAYVLGNPAQKKVDFLTPERAERRAFDLSEVDRRFAEKYHDFYDDVKNTNKTEDW